MSAVAFLSAAVWATFFQSETARPGFSFFCSLERTSYRQGREERVAGDLWFLADGSLHIRIFDPIEQHFVSEKERLLIYYPKEERACKIGDAPGVFGFFNAFLSALRPDCGLVELGFQLTRHAIANDTLSTVWMPSPALQRLCGEVKLIFTDDRLCRVEAEGPQGRGITRTHYDQYAQIGGRRIPTRIATCTVVGADSTYETVKFEDCRFDQQPPDDIAHFVLPPGVQIEELK